jgi:hypothetical protein
MADGGIRVCQMLLRELRELNLLEAEKKVVLKITKA